MLHACDQRFDVTENLENFWEVNKALVNLDSASIKQPTCPEPIFSTVRTSHVRIDQSVSCITLYRLAWLYLSLSLSLSRFDLLLAPLFYFSVWM